MRFLLYDRFRTIVPGERAEAVKAVSLTEEFLRGHHPRAPTFPPALVLESMIQAAGGLVMASHEFAVLPFLSLVEEAVLPPTLAPGVLLELEATLVSTGRMGSVAKARATVDGREVASAGRIVYGHFPVPDAAALRRRFADLGVLP
jgi:3-hydroxymyristoyl/3-hydroxydecanoyl-(acyl carrier protein) dehydratase